MTKEQAGYIIGNLKDCEEYDPCEIQEAKAMAIDALWAEPKVGRCEDCKHFRKLPLRTDTIGKCIQHWGVCPPCDWYCADFEPQERNLCDSCKTKGCIFQYGIVRSHCDFYKAESEVRNE